MTTNETTIDTTTSTDIWFAGTFMRVLADAGSTHGQFALIEQWAPAGFSPPLHVHEHEDQMFYVLAGELTVRLGEEESILTAGDTAWLPRGTPHTFRVDSDDARLVEISTPAGFEGFHLELAAPATEHRIPDPGRLDVPAMAAASARYGCDIIGPPMSPA